MKNEFSLPALGWILLAFVCLSLILIGLRLALKRTGWTLALQRRLFYRTLGVFLIWTTLLLVLAYRGFFSDFNKLPPRPALALLVPLPFILRISFSKKGGELLRSIPAHWLVFMQSFRIAVELLLVAAFTAGELPVQMTFEGRNFDIVSGMMALPVGFLLMKKSSASRKLAIAFNIIGLVLLINILVIAILSMPTPIRYFMNEPANVLVAGFPYILLPGLLVPFAYGLHILSLRQLLNPSTKKINQIKLLQSGVKKVL